MISEKKILELWKIKLAVYALRDASWIKKVVFVPLLVLGLDIGISEFRKSIVLLSLLIGIVYSILSIGIYRKIRFVQSSKKRINSMYPLIAILHNTFDLVTLSSVTISFFIMAMLAVAEGPFENLILVLMFTLLLLIVLVSLLFSPKILASKSLSHLNDTKSSGRLLFILSIASTVPSFFIFISALITQIGDVNLLKVIFGFFSYTGSMLLVPYIVTGFVELAFLIKNKFRNIEK